MGYIINVNSESKQALALLELAKTFDFIEIKKVEEMEKTDDFPSDFKERIQKNLRQVELLKKGKLKTKSLDDFLNEL